MVMWAAFANCYDCIAYVENASEIAKYYKGKENPFFDGLGEKNWHARLISLNECLSLLSIICCLYLQWNLRL